MEDELMPSVILREVAFTSRREAEGRSGSPTWAIISISDPMHYPAQLKRGWHEVLRFEFNDIERESWPAVLFTPDDARKIVAFVSRVAFSCDGVLVHCKAGASRSAAIARWIAEQYGLPFDFDYAGYNRHIYRTLCECGEETVARGCHCGDGQEDGK